MHCGHHTGCSLAKHVVLNALRCAPLGKIKPDMLQQVVLVEKKNTIDVETKQTDREQSI